QVKTSVAKKWAGDLLQFQQDVDKDLKPRSRLLGVRASGNVDVKPEMVETANVGGKIAGNGKLDGEIVVVGAHYDHLGYGGEGSMKPNVHAIHHGADDNASGVAGVLEIAQSLNLLHDIETAPASANLKPSRTIVFVLFSGEE